jgi:hypothetical protein
MKALYSFALVGTSLLAISSSCEKKVAAPSAPLVTGQLVRLETTVDAGGRRPQPRWGLEVSPLSFPGWAGAQYQEVKVFGLPDTITYRPGRSIQFRYQFVPQAQQTPWRTSYEWNHTAQIPAWGERVPELALSDVHLVPLN